MFSRKGSSTNSYSKVNLDEFSDDDSNAAGEDDFVNQSMKKQQELLRKQDEGLDMLSASVLRLGEMSMGISEELGHQNKMLDAMETDLDDAAENLDIVTRSTQEFIKQAGGTKNCIIILVLSVVALILFFLVLYA